MFGAVLTALGRPEVARMSADTALPPKTGGDALSHSL